MSIIRRASANVREARSVTYGSSDPYAIPSNGSLASFATSGVSVDKQTAMSLAAVYASVRIISTLIGSTPIYTLKEEGAGRFTRVDQHPLIANPFGDAYGIPVERQIGMEQVLVSKLLRGNSYNLITEWDSRGTPTQIMPLDPDVVRVDLNDGRKRFWVSGKVIDPDLIVHIPGLSMPGSPIGISPVAYLRQTIGLGIAAEEFASRFFANGATMSGVIELDGDLDPDAARQLKERFTARHSGLRNSHSVGVLTGGAKWKPMTVAPHDAMLIETQQFNVSQIAMVFGVPPHLLGNVMDVSAAWGVGVEAQTMAFLTYGLRAWFTRIENALTNLLPLGLVARFDLSDLLRTDSMTRSRLANSARTGGWMTTNEIRAQEGLPPIEGGDDIAQPLNSAHNGQNDQTTVESQTPPAAK